MILTREIEIKINESNYQYYDDLGYDVTIGEIIRIPIELMSKGSHYKIKCECDVCKIKKVYCIVLLALVELVLIL